MEKNNKKRIRMSFIAISIVIIVAVIISIMIKYQVEGETNMPFNLSRIMIISSAQGIEKEDLQDKWNLDIVQNNDIYIDISKNKNYSKTEIIDKIILENFKINNNPQKGTINIYRPNNEENGVFTNSEEYKIEDKLEYVGSEKSDIKNLQIANQGGLILLRYVNEELGNYISNEDNEIKHDGTLLNKIGIKNEQLKFDISFDISIILQSEKTYKATVELQMPIGDVTKQGTTNYTKTDFSDVVFKRD